MNKKLLFLAFFFFILGAIYFLVRREKIIILLGGSDKKSKSIVNSLKEKFSNRKKIRLHYWKEGKFSEEEISVVWHDDDTDNIKNLVNYWLNWMYQERIVDKRVFATSVCLSGQDIYLSFDKIFFSDDWSIVKKWYFVESLLKTLRGVSTNLNLVFFRLKHQVFDDYHLDFSQGWPITGFLEEEK